MIINNKKLYEQDEVVGKYSANTTRVRSLNNCEKEFIDRFDIKNKKVLVLGCGAGRVPVNLLIFGNQVVGVDRSEALLNFAIKTFPKNKFSDLDFILADMCDLSKIPDENFDTVIFPGNSIDYLQDYRLREIAIVEATKKLKKYIKTVQQCSCSSWKNSSHAAAGQLLQHSRKAFLQGSGRAAP